MNRRRFLGAGAAWLCAARAAQAFANDEWRTFEVTTRVELPPTAELTRVWLPMAYAGGPAYQRVVKQRWTGSSAVLRAIRDEAIGTGILFAEWPTGDTRPEVELTLTVATRDRKTDWSDVAMRRQPTASLQRYLQPSQLIPLGGIVGETARRITRAESNDVGRARAIYEWIVDNTSYDPAAGGGSANIRMMLESRNLRGTSAELNRLFVALARAVGIPSREVFGLRVGVSRSFRSLGTNGDVTTAQHCRAEFHSERQGWIPVDPADVRKIILEEKPGLDLRSPEVQYARRQLFGSWEMNWVAFNHASDVALPHASGERLPFLAYPQAQVGTRKLDSSNPGAFRYRITAREL